MSFSSLLPINVNVYNSNIHDCTLFKEQLFDLKNINKNTIIIGDGTYDSNDLQNIITNIGGNNELKLILRVIMS